MSNQVFDMLIGGIVGAALTAVYFIVHWMRSLASYVPDTKLRAQVAELKNQSEGWQLSYEEAGEEVNELQGELKHSRSVAQSWFEKAGRQKGELEEARKSLVVFKEHNKEINDRLDKMGVGGNFWLIASRLDDVGDKLDELKEAQERGDEMAESIQLLKDSVAARGERIAELEGVNRYYKTALERIGKWNEEGIIPIREIAKNALQRKGE